MTGNKNPQRHKPALKIYIGIAALTILLHVLAWSSTAFSDAYIAYVFPVWVNTYGRLTGIFPFSVGEWLIIAGILLIFSALVMAVISGIPKTRRTAVRFFRFFAWVVLTVCLIMTLNCFILYHGSTFSERYFGADTGEYSVEALLRVRNSVVRACNRLSAEVERDEQDYILYRGSYSAAGNIVDMEDKA